MNKVGVNNKTGIEVDKKFVRKVALAALKSKGARNKEISVVFLERDEIRQLNKQYRKLDKATDVLSFGEGANSDFLGEIAISPDVVRKRFSENFDNAVACVLIHGILHLMGYDHAISKERKIMREEENRILDQVLKLSINK